MKQRFLIAQLNIEHFRRKLSEATDDANRRTISSLLAEEEAKLAALQSVAKRDLEQILHTVAHQVADFLDRERPKDGLRESAVRLAPTIDQLPMAVGLMDRTGQWVIANKAMRRFVPRKNPSADLQRIRRWRAFDAEGHPLSPTYWPSARALRGETANPGIEFIYTTDEGQQVKTRVAAMPIRYPDGQIAGAIVVVDELETLATQQEAC